MKFEKIRDIIAKQLDLDPESITMESRLVEDLKADSLDVVELIMAFEDETGLTVPDEDVMELKTLGAICDYIEKRIGL